MTYRAFLIAMRAVSCLTQGMLTTLAWHHHGIYAGIGVFVALMVVSACDHFYDAAKREAKA